MTDHQDLIYVLDSLSSLDPSDIDNHEFDLVVDTDTDARCSVSIIDTACQASSAIGKLQSELDKATRALTRAGFTLVEGAQEWKPPIGPSASPLLDRIDQLAAQLKDATSQCGVMAELLRRSRPIIDDRADFGLVAGRLLRDIDAALAGKLSDTAVTVTETIRTAPERIWLQVGDQSHYHSEPFPSDTSEVSWCADSVVACEVPYVRADLVGKIPGRQDTEWTDATTSPTAEDYHELQAQHDQLQSKYKAAMDLLSGFVSWEKTRNPRDLWPLLQSVKKLMAGHVPAPVVPQGWQLVPVEPTEEILRAIRSAVLVESCYRAMLAAAPKPEGAA